jgi:hypothetical protein
MIWIRINSGAFQNQEAVAPVFLTDKDISSAVQLQPGHQPGNSSRPRLPALFCLSGKELLAFAVSLKVRQPGLLLPEGLR